MEVCFRVLMCSGCGVQKYGLQRILHFLTTPHVQRLMTRTVNWDSHGQFYDCVFITWIAVHFTTAVVLVVSSYSVHCLPPCGVITHCLQLLLMAACWLCCSCWPHSQTADLARLLQEDVSWSVSEWFRIIVISNHWATFNSILTCKHCSDFSGLLYLLTKLLQWNHVVQM